MDASDRGSGEVCLATRSRVEAVVDRMAAQVLATSEEVPLLLGILRRGAPIAQALAARIEARTGSPPTVGQVRLKRYADDLTLLHRRPELEPVTPGLKFKGASVLLVDDVLYTGWTILRAADWLAEMGARSVRAAVLCARSEQEREVPVKADFVGLRFDVEHSGIIEVHMPPFEEDWAVMLGRRPAAL
jgi:pyrimidine operon attenuation protein / uracil phosphoribosyltransferase